LWIYVLKDNRYGYDLMEGQQEWDTPYMLPDAQLISGMMNSLFRALVNILLLKAGEHGWDDQKRNRSWSHRSVRTCRHQYDRSDRDDETTGQEAQKGVVVQGAKELDWYVLCCTAITPIQWGAGHQECVEH
jgi:hypothetical protein